MTGEEKNARWSAGAPRSEEENLTEFDFRVQDEGTIIVLHPCNDYARTWIQETLYGDDSSPTWWGGGVVIDRRCFVPIFDSLVDEGYVLH